MSYSRHYSANVHYSGSVSYSYPPSEHGGSGHVSYSGYVPVDITAYVDTDPLESSVSECNRSLAVLGGSVSLLDVAEVKSIKENSEKISSHIIGGFFKMIGSELSQQIVALRGKINGAIGKIREKSALLSSQRNVMQQDYFRVERRYARVFEELDEEGRRRIAELDRQSFSISKLNSENESRVSANVNALFLNANEISSVRNKLSAASLRARTSAVIDSLYSNMEQKLTYEKNVKEILSDDAVQCFQTICVPAVIATGTSISGVGDDTNVYVPALSGIDSAAKAFLAGQVSGLFVTQEEEKQISRSFNNLMEEYHSACADEKSERVSRMMNLLRRGEYDRA